MMVDLLIKKHSKLSLDINHNDAIQVPVGSEAQRPQQMLRFNSESGYLRAIMMQHGELEEGRSWMKMRHYITPEETQTVIL